MMGSVPEGGLSINLPHDFVLQPHSDVEKTKKMIDELPCNSLAAVLIEPMLGNGSCVGKGAFVQYLRAICSELGALFIFDEVMTSRLFYYNSGFDEVSHPLG